MSMQCSPAERADIYLVGNGESLNYDVHSQAHVPFVKATMRYMQFVIQPVLCYVILVTIP